MNSKRLTTRAKLERERLVEERRALKRERKRAAAAGGGAQTGEAADSLETVAGDAGCRNREGGRLLPTVR
jgi:hypothetical protein